MIADGVFGARGRRRSAGTRRAREHIPWANPGTANTTGTAPGSGIGDRQDCQPISGKSRRKSTGSLVSPRRHSARGAVRHAVLLRGHTRGAFRTSFFCLVAVVAAIPASAGTWGTQVVLANNGYSGSVTIDAAGNLAVVWYQSPVNEIFAATAAFGHPWSAPVNISGAVSPGAVSVLGSTSGNATAIYTTATSTGTYVDHLAGGNWGAPGPTNGVNQFHVSNDRGDEGLAWSTGGARPTSSTIDAVVRPAGGTWSLASTVATGVHLAFDGALMLSDGSMAVA